MSKKTKQDQVLLDEVENKIYVIRGERVMLPPAMRIGVSALRYEMKLSPTEIFKGKTIYFLSAGWSADTVVRMSAASARTNEHAI